MTDQEFAEIIGNQEVDQSLKKEQVRREARIQAASTLVACLETEGGKLIVNKLNEILDLLDYKPESFLIQEETGIVNVNVAGLAEKAGQRTAIKTILKWFESERKMLERVVDMKSE